jgi:hypothetical protein
MLFYSWNLDSGLATASVFMGVLAVVAWKFAAETLNLKIFILD